MNFLYLGTLVLFLRLFYTCEGCKKFPVPETSVRGRCNSRYVW